MLQVALIKENAGQPNTYPTQSGKGVSQGLASVRKAAREQQGDEDHRLALIALNDAEVVVERAVQRFFQSNRNDGPYGLSGGNTSMKRRLAWLRQGRCLERVACLWR